MAKATSSKTTTPKRILRVRKRRPGIVSKTKTSSIKGSRNYKKTYRGQGR